MAHLFPHSFELSVPVTMRQAEEHDLELMEWFGIFTHDRHVIRDTWERQVRGEGLMLVADVKGYPVGQLWIDPVSERDSAVAIIWAFRVFPFFRGTGLGSRLMDAAEELIGSRGFAAAEVSVDICNDGARRLYERRGYRVIRTDFPIVELSHPDGSREEVRAHRLVMRKPLTGAPELREAESHARQEGRARYG